MFNRSRYDTILSLLPGYLGDALADGDSIHYSRLLGTHGRVFMVKGRLAESEEAINDAMAMAISLADTVNWLNLLSFKTFLLSGRGDLSGALELSREKLDLSIAARNERSEGWARIGIAYINLRRGGLGQAEIEYAKAARIFSRTGDREYEMTALGGLGLVFQNKGDLSGARRAFSSVRHLARGGSNPMEEASALCNLGSMEYIYGDIALAVDYFEQALEIFNKIGFQYGAIDPSLNLCNAYTYIGRYEDSISLLERTLSLCESHGFRSQSGPVLAKIGQTRRAQGRPGAAAVMFRKALSLDEAISMTTHDEAVIGLANCLAARDSAMYGCTLLEDRLAMQPPPAPKLKATMAKMLARFYRETDRSDEALDWALQAEQMTRSDTSSSRTSILTETSECCRSAGRLEEAHRWFLSALQIEEKNRDLTTEHEWREALGQHTHDALLSSGSVILEHPRGLHPDRRVEKWFDTVQRFKARTLLERITEPRHRSHGPGLTTIGPMTLEKLRSDVLSPGELFLDFSVGQSETWLFAVTIDSCRLVTMPGSDAPWTRWIETMCRSFATSPDDPDVDCHSQFQGALGNELLGPVVDLLREATKLVIATDGFISSVPFAAIRLDMTHEGRHEVLANMIGIEYVPSAAVLRHMRLEGSSSGKMSGGGLLVLGNRRGAHEVLLEGSVREIGMLERRYRDTDVNWSGNTRATAPFSAGGRSPEILHIAGHIVADPQRPWRSGILWDRYTRSHVEDSLDTVDQREVGVSSDPYLRAAEISGMTVQSELVVLSGCESAGGKMTAGEGVLGLTAAFLSAGTKAVVATLWPIDDDVTADMMSAFYRELEKGETATEALRTAQMTIASRPETAHPFYWGAFIVVGRGDATVRLQRNHSRTIALLTIIFSALIIGSVSIQNRFRRSRNIIRNDL